MYDLEVDLVILDAFGIFGFGFLLGERTCLVVSECRKWIWVLLVVVLMICLQVCDVICRTGGFWKWFSIFVGFALGERLSVLEVGENRKRMGFWWCF